MGHLFGLPADICPSNAANSDFLRLNRGVSQGFPNVGTRDLLYTLGVPRVPLLAGLRRLVLILCRLRTTQKLSRETGPTANIS